MKVANKAKPVFAALPKDYAGLCRRHLPRPIHDASEYADVTEMTDAMVLWQDDFTPDQADYFALLCSLLEDYDAENVKWPKVSGREMVRHLLEQHEQTAADLSRILGGSRNLGAMILRGERNLTLEHVRKLAIQFSVPAGLLIQGGTLNTNAKKVVINRKRTNVTPKRKLVKVASFA